jgi:Leucine-rich repeat (LRR) protein
MASVELPDAQYFALYELYNCTNGVAWQWRNESTGVPWQFETKANPCRENWQGLGCSVTGSPPQEEYTIVSIDLSSRNLQGRLPSSVDTFRNLVSLNLPHNAINGTVPRSLGTLLHLEHLGLTSNELIGTIPETLANLSYIKHLGFDYNQLTGTVPDIFSNLTDLRAVLLAHNHISDTIPSVLGSLKKLVYLYLNHNGLYGTIPTSLGNLTKLAYFDLDSNQLHGSIPDSFAQLTRLHFLGLHNNALTGTIPYFLGELTKLQFLYLNNERFVGTIPGSFRNLKKLLFLHMQYNQLTGTIPNSFGELQDLQYLYMNNNMLTGTLPQSLSGLRNLNSLLVQGNALVGSLDGVFNSTAQRKLKTVQVSNNALTGELPDALFEMESLATLIAVSTCFHGSLPASVCSARRLDTLVLDGLRSNAACAKIIIPGFNGELKHSNTFGGTIPPCLFGLASLNTLHLSGNGLSGSLPSDLGVNKQLLDLDLSHNILSGSIPDTIQNQVWYNLDLSYNRFQGELSSAFYGQRRNLTFSVQFENYILNFTELPTSVSLSIENNRLSGDIPGSIKDIQNISILTANIFSCAIDKSDLPENDSGETAYTCASNAFDVPYYAWLVLASCIVCAAGAVWHSQSALGKSPAVTALTERARKWLSILQWPMEPGAQRPAQLPNVRYIATVLGLVEKACILCLAFILCILLPLYAIETVYFGTHAREYTYSVSACFKSGVTPFALELVLLTLMLLLLVAGAVRVRGNLEGAAAGTVATPRESCDFETAQAASRQDSSELMRVLARVAYFVINLVVVLGVNVSFVVIALYQSSVVLVIAQIMLSLFKVFWNLVCSPFLIRWTSQYLSTTSSAEDRASGTIFFALQMFVSLFNNIIIPCFVVAIVDPNCFYNVFIPARTETSHYLFAVCKVYAFQGCLQVVPQVASASYNPPFIYSYQCSSSFVTYYAPTFIYVCFVATFVSPLMQYAGLLLHQRCEAGTWSFRALDLALPPVWKPVNPTDAAPVQRSVYRPFFDANLLIVTLVTYLGIMLTFGAVFPPLAAALAVTLFVVSYFGKLKVGRLICAALESNQPAYLAIIEAECYDAGTVVKLQQALRMVVSVCCIFYALFLFDTLGNAAGFAGAVWVLFVVPLTPPVVYSIANLVVLLKTPARSPPLKPTPVDDSNEKSTEMRDLRRKSGEISDDLVEENQDGVVSSLHAVV